MLAKTKLNEYNFFFIMVKSTPCLLAAFKRHFFQADPSCNFFHLDNHGVLEPETIHTSKYYPQPNPNLKVICKEKYLCHFSFALYPLQKT